MGDSRFHLDDLLYRIIAVYVVISGNNIVRPNILFFYKVGAVIFSRVDGC